MAFRLTESDDDNGQTGWTMADGRLTRNTDTDNWGTRNDTVLLIRIRGVAGTINKIPTAANASVTATKNEAYTLSASDFQFSDEDADDALATIKIVTLPDAGTLTLDEAEVTAGDEITRADLDGGRLKFTPATDAIGDPYATFTFKVNDGEDESESDYTMTIRVLLDTATYGDPVKAIIEVNSGWQEFTLETRVAKDWFAVDLGANKRYYIRINTAENTRWPRLAAAYGPAPDHLQHTHGSGADCSRGPGGRGCAGHGWFEIRTFDASHPAGRYYFHVNAPHSITEQPDEDFRPGENPYEYSVMVEGPTEGDGNGRSAPPSPLRAFLNDEPDHHNGSDPFTLELAFDDSIKAYAADVSDSITVTNGSLTTIAQNESDITRWNLTVTPSGADTITVELAASVPCDEDGALCTFNGRRLSQGVQTTIGYLPPPPTISSVSLVTDAGDNDAWDTDELVTAEVAFTGPVYIQGQPTLGITLTGTRHEAAYASGRRHCHAAVLPPDYPGTGRGQ